MKPIYLVGFMGSGKSTLGKALSKKFDKRWIDLDIWIEAKEGCSITDIFNQRGEAFFRRLETEALHETKGLKNTIIATGGGSVESPYNRLLLEEETVIYLQWPFEQLYEHIKGDNKRPLVTTYDELKVRYEKRVAAYEAVATEIIACEYETCESVCEKLTPYFK